jgi:hypothetical protein
MYKPSVDFNPVMGKLREIIRVEDRFDEAMKLCYKIHAFVHESSVSAGEDAINIDDKIIYDGDQTLADAACENLRDIDYYTMPTVKDVTIAWNIWHLARIEDITMNILVGGGNQVFDEKWRGVLNTEVKDTGNAMSDDEIIKLSKELNKPALLEYRRAVGKRSREILASLRPADMKRKFMKECVESIPILGCLTEQPDSIWLMDFWGRKDVAGILLMPLTRHQEGHLNDCIKLKKKCENLNK